MDKKLHLFLSRIGIEDETPFSNGCFTSFVNESEYNRITCRMRLDDYLPLKNYDQLFELIPNYINTNWSGVKFTMSFEYSKGESIERLLDEYIEKNNSTALNDHKILNDEKKVIFYYSQPSEVISLDVEARKLKDYLDSISSTFRVLTQMRVEISDEEFIENIDEEYQMKSDELADRLIKKRELDSAYQPCLLKDVEKFQKVLVQGKIFKINEDKKYKKGIIRTIEYTDGSDSITSTFFESKKTPFEFIDQFKVGMTIKVKGRPFKDKYNHNEVAINIDEITQVVGDEERMDKAVNKRVEFHLHTQMSAFDGVTNVEDYIKRAAKWGHKAIAITDHGVCQAFPDAQAAGKKYGIKVIYGAELYVVDDKTEDANFIYNPAPRPLKNTNYVVFDTETTGLSCRYDRLIEFGAVRISPDGHKLDEIDFFIRPDRKISAFSLEVSHITQEMADSGKDIKSALRDILEFFQDDILVAHNASFDFDFLNEALKNNGMPTIKNPVIDTLQLSRYLYPDMRSHREESLARRFNLTFSKTGAHRANYDAEHLSMIFLQILADLMSNNKDITHEDLASLPVTNEMLLTMHPYHVTAYCKNSDGLKDLYRIISESNTEHISKSALPLVPLTYLESHRKDLILGSACFNGEIFEMAQTKGRDKLKQKMKFYDFIEVQPPNNYIYLVHKGQISSMDDVKKILTDIIDCAKEMDKPVLATSDCHYLDPEDKIYRDVFIAINGLKGAKHPLNLAPRDTDSDEVKEKWYKNPLPNPNQHLRTTDEMKEEFAFLSNPDLIEEIVVGNTNRFADLISDDISPIKDKLYTPSIPNAEEMLSSLAFKTAKEKYGDPLPEVILNRLNQELDGIISNGYAVIYWLSSEIVRWSNSNGYLIGSRGSVGSSLVATMTGITEVNPLPPHYLCPKCHHLEWADVLQYESGFDLPYKECPDCHIEMLRDGQNIPFATFLGFHAEKVPDIDLNFPSDFQATAQEHMKEMLDKTGNICYKAGTIQTVQDKNARKFVLLYYKTLGKEFKEIRNAEIDRIAVGCVGVKRSTGQHAGGVIVIPKGMEVYDFTPVQYPADDTDATWKTTHYDFHKIHDNVLKFDMLGHVDPQAVRMQCELCNIPFEDMNKIVKITDPDALSLFWSSEKLNLKSNILQQETGALGLPEFGTENGRRVLIETQPRSVADLVRISGLSHGTNVFAGNAEDLIQKEGFRLKDVIACRDDIMTVLHDKYNLDNSDAFAIMEFTRKGNFGKPGNDDKKAKFIAIMQEHNVPDWYIESCKKIAYMFPKGHAIAYVTNAIRCAWFKVHRPLAYYATYFTLRCDGYDIKTMMKGISSCLKRRNEILDPQNANEESDKDTKIINALEQTIEMYDRGYSFAPLSIINSEATAFKIDEKKGQLIPPLITVDGLGANAGLNLVNARKERPFTSIEDLKKRGKISDKMVLKLRELNALDGLPESDQITLFNLF